MLQKCAGFILGKNAKKASEAESHDIIITPDLSVSNSCHATEYDLAFHLLPLHNTIDV